MVASKYADPLVARRNLEALLAATIEASCLDVEGLGADGPAAYQVLDEVAALARRAYRELVYQLAGFVEWFRAATPIGEIAELNIGSRPASRRPSHRIEDLRAIPWVFSWSQCRIMLPGWYGVGTAIETWIDGDESRVAQLRALHERWPFFRAVLSNMAMVLAKTDLEIGERYAGLVPDPHLGRAVFARLAAEHERTTRALARDHRSRVAARRRRRPGAHDPTSLPVPRSVESPAGRAAASLERRRPERAGAARDPPDDQRPRHGSPQQRVTSIGSTRFTPSAP